MGRSRARRRSSQGVSRATWARWSERATLARQPGDVKDAGRAFAELPVEAQLALAREVVATRAAELCRAYADVVGVAWGMRRRRGRVRREPCVVFVVKHKQARARVSAARRAPKHLFAFWTIGGERKLCAIPTDIEDAGERAAIRPRAEIETRTSDGAVEHGVITWAVERTDEPGRLYAVSCKHVFSPALSAAFSPAEVRVNGSDTVLGQTSRVAGRLEDELRWSLDSQLAEVLSEPELRAALDDVWVTGIATGPADVTGRDEMWIAAPTRSIRAQFKEHLENGAHPIDYGVGGASHVLHEELFLLDVDASTSLGESGSPVLSDRRGGILLGMHIAGNGGRSTLMIPAWRFITPHRYGHADDAATWTPWTRTV